MMSQTLHKISVRLAIQHAFQSAQSSILLHRNPSSTIRDVVSKETLGES
jgi:hypothetical protein